MSDKERIIRETYFDPEDGFGSVLETYRIAHTRDSSITRTDVKTFLDNLEIRQRKRGGLFNSFVANLPREQFQVDLADMTGFEAPSLIPFEIHVKALASALDKRVKAVPSKSMDLGAAATFLRARDGFSEDFRGSRGLTMKRLLEGFEGLSVSTGKKGGKTLVALTAGRNAVKINSSKSKQVVRRYALCVVDIFSKKASVQPLATKNPPEVKDRFIQALKELGPPLSIYTDEDGAFQNEFADLLRSENIEHRVTRAHAPFVERFIRTLKRLVFLRQEGGNEEPSWEELLPSVISKYNRTSSSVHGFTPTYAHNWENAFHVKQALMLHAKKKRIYPPLDVGDSVRLLKKPGKLTQRKEQYKEWSDIRKIESILPGEVTFYVLVGEDAGRTQKRNGFMRHELLKVSEEKKKPQEPLRRRIRGKTDIGNRKK